MEVDVLVAVDVPDPRALRAGHEQRVGRRAPSFTLDTTRRHGGRPREELLRLGRRDRPARCLARPGRRLGRVLIDARHGFSHQLQSPAGTTTVVRTPLAAAAYNASSTALSRTPSEKLADPGRPSAIAVTNSAHIAHSWPSQPIDVPSVPAISSSAAPGWPGLMRTRRKPNVNGSPGKQTRNSSGRSRSQAAEPSEPYSSIWSETRLPIATRLVSSTPYAPLSKFTSAAAASSTSTGPVSCCPNWAPPPRLPTASAPGNGRSVMNVADSACTATISPTRKRAQSTR